MPDLVLTPRGPYSLALSAAYSDPTRECRDGIVRLVYRAGGDPVAVSAAQDRGGTVRVRFARNPSEAEIAHVRFMLAVDDDHSPFLDAVATDALLGPAVARARGLRPVRLATVAHALVRAVCGQLITAREARLIEGRILARVCDTAAGLRVPPSAADLCRLSPADLVRCGLAPRRAAALARTVRTLDLERLREVPTARAVARIVRERTLGPWSAGVICLYGLGRMDHGLVGDLNLIRLCANLLGRDADAGDTAALLARYDPWAGLAGVHLMRHPLARRRRLPDRAAA